MKKTNKILSIILAVMMILTAVPLTGMTAFAAESVTYVDRTWDDTNKKVVEKTETATATPIESSTTSITLDGGWYVVSGNVEITEAITVNGTPEEPTRIILKDGCKLTVSKSILVKDGKALVIYAQAGDRGAIDTSSGGQNAGIGGGARTACGTVIIKGGEVSAKGGSSGGAGIGGGYAGGGGGTVTVYGGTVEATGRKYSAGIGGGGSTSSGGVGGALTVYGGTVFAAGNGYGAGIGGARGGAGGTVTVYDGRVDATGGNNAAGIGGGYSGDGGTVTVNGGKVTAMGGGEGAGIGGGYSGKGGTLTISGGEVVATGGNNAAGIGNLGANEGTVKFTGGTVVATGFNRNPGIAGAIIADYDVMRAGDAAPGEDTTLDDYLTARSTYAYIHNHAFVNGKCSVCGKECEHEYDESGVCTICGAVPYIDRYWDDTNNKLVEETKTATATAITASSTALAGGWYVVSGNVEITEAITVNGTSDNPTCIILADGCKLTASKGIVVNSGKALAIYVQTAGRGKLDAVGNSSAAGIGGSGGKACGTITINGGTINATAGSSSAGIGGGRTGAGGNITINGGTVTATGGSNSAGIGGSSSKKGGTVTVNGGTVTATGGDMAAGIGGGNKGAGGTVTINGGTVTATGGYNAAGIGGGDGGAGGSVKINGGTVTATGGDYGAGIGGGDEGDGGTVTINGGTVNATGGYDVDYDGSGGAGIGGGDEGDGGTVTITGGTVTATGGLNAAGIGGGDWCESHGVLEADYEVMRAGDAAPGEDTTLDDYITARSTYAYIHTHKFDSYTDNGDGTHSRTCACEAKENVKIDHTFVNGVCTFCGAEEPTHEHVFSTEWTKNETAHWHKCTAEDCDITNYAECGITEAAYGTHQWRAATEADGDNAYCAPTCENDGWYKNICTVCGALSENSTVISALGHDLAWDGNVGTDGQHTLACSRCEYTEKENCTLVNGKCSVCGFVSDVKPVANVEEITAEGYDYAVKYSIATPASANYNDWAADIIITADKDVPAGAVTLRGQYGSYDKSLPAPAMTAGTEYSLLAALGENITYFDLADVVKEFTCGIINNALEDDTTFSIKVVLSNGTDEFVVKGSDAEKALEAVIVKPVANVEKITAEGYDYAVKYTIAKEASENYNDWAADIIITADKDVAAGAVTFRGQYGSYDKSLPAPAMTAGTEFSLLTALGENITYFDLADVVKEFTCGIINNALEDDTTFSIKVVLSNGTETFDVEGSDTEKEFEAVIVEPVANVEKVTADGYDYAVKYTIDTPASANFNDWIADIIITADKNVAEGAVTFRGQYGSYDKSFAAPAMTAGTEYSLLTALGETLTYEDLAKYVQEFTCGVINNSLEEDTNFTIKVVLSKDGETLDVEGSEATINAENLEIYEVKVTNDATVSQVYNPAKSTKYQIATVKIKEANGIRDGQWFVYWVDQDGNIVSTYSTYSFFVVENRTLTPVYVSPSVYNAERAKGVKVTEIVRADDNQDGTVTLYTEHSASAAAVGNEILQHGFIWTTDASKADSLEFMGEGVNTAAAAKTNKALTGLFRATVEVEEGETVYAVPFIVDADANITYGEKIEFTAGEQIATRSIASSTLETMLVQEEEVIPTEEEVPTVEEPETIGSIFSEIITSFVNAVVELVQYIISLF